MTKFEQNRRKDLEPFFKAHSIAIIGASPDQVKIGGRILQSLLTLDYEGMIYPVNPRYVSIANLTCYPSVNDLPDPVELAVVAAPAVSVLPTLCQCAEKGIKGAVVITSGFSETGEEGLQLESDMVALANHSGMRIMGPNCLGVINNLNGLWASFGPLPPTKEHCYKRRFSLISQSGFFGSFIYLAADYQKLGFTHFASVGNQTDLNFTDFLEYMIDDSNVEIIGSYIEGLKEGRRFLVAAREALLKHKPIVAMKVGRTQAGAKAATSHTGSLAGETRIYDAAFDQVGIVNANSIDHFLAVLTILAAERQPPGPRVAVVSISGGGAVILSDECELSGLELAEFSPETILELDRVLPFFASSVNPVDLTAQAFNNPDLLLKCLKLIATDSNVDMIAMNLHVGYELIDTVANTLVEVYNQIEKPMVAIGCPYGAKVKVEKALAQIRSAGLPVFNAADSGFWAVAEFLKWQKKAQNTTMPAKTLPGKERDMAINFLRSLPDHQKNLTEFQAARVLEPYGITFPKSKIASTADEAVEIASNLGYPVVLKIQSPDILHKTDVGGLVTNLTGPEEVRAGYRLIIDSVNKNIPQADIDGVLVQKMVASGHEIIIGVKQDPVFGPVIMFGLGGIFTEVLRDVSFKVAPLTRLDAENMIREIRGYPVLAGVRGKPPADLTALTDVLLKVSRLALELEDEIEEIDINPLLVFDDGGGTIAVDALISRR